MEGKFLHHRLSFKISTSSHIPRSGYPAALSCYHINEKPTIVYVNPSLRVTLNTSTWSRVSAVAYTVLSIKTAVYLPKLLVLPN